MRRLLTLTLVAVACLAGCGGGNDKKDAGDTVKQFFTALQKRDTAKLCNRLLTKDFIESTTGTTGDEAKRECQSQPQIFRLKKEDGDWRLANSGQ